VTAQTLVRIDAPLPIQNGSQPGNFGIVNRCQAGGGAAHAVAIQLDSPSGSDTAVLNNDGDSMSIPASEVASATIYSPDGGYPIYVLLLNSALDIALSAAPVIGNTTTNPVPVTVV
jgi:hypothetical protein